MTQTSCNRGSNPAGLIATCRVGGKANYEAGWRRPETARLGEGRTPVLPHTRGGAGAIPSRSAGNPERSTAVPREAVGRPRRCRPRSHRRCRGTPARPGPRAAAASSAAQTRRDHSRAAWASRTLPGHAGRLDRGGRRPALLQRRRLRLERLPHRLAVRGDGQVNADRANCCNKSRSRTTSGPRVWIEETRLLRQQGFEDAARQPQRARPAGTGR